MAYTPPATVAQFKAQFDRDFQYGSGTDKVRDTDITRAFTDALMVWNPCLWRTEEKVNAFCYAAAHFLVLSLQAAGGLAAPSKALGPQNRGGGVVQTKSVGGVSVGYQMPDFVAKSAILSQFMRTDYGQRYLQLVTPRLVGNLDIVAGERDPGVSTPNIPYAG